LKTNKERKAKLMLENNLTCMKKQSHAKVLRKADFQLTLQQAFFIARLA
jgi:hypothetical protein